MPDKSNFGEGSGESFWQSFVHKPKDTTSEEDTRSAKVRLAKPRKASGHQEGRGGIAWATLCVPA